MTAARLLEHFTGISEAPGAVERLRAFVLGLAARGKLVEHDGREESASELLKRIKAEKDHLIKTGGIRKPKPLPKVKQEEFPYRIPPNWVWSRLADVSLRIHYGYTASATKALEDVRLLRITDIQNNRVDWRSVPGCAIPTEKVAQYVLADGDILIARTGGTIGKSFLVKDVPVRAVFASYLIRIQGSRELFARFLKLFLESPIYWSQLVAGARGAGQPNVNGRTLGKMALPLPPLAEQKRIVAKVDELMALCDEWESAQAKRESRRDRLVAAALHGLNNGAAPQEQRQAARFYFNHLPRLTTRPEHIGQLRQTILNLAVRGKLVPQEATDLSVTDLLTTVDGERRVTADNDRRAQPGPQDMLAQDMRWSLPSTWTWRGLADLALFIDYRGKTPRKIESGIRLVTAKNVRRGFISKEPEEFISESTYSQWMTRGLPQVGDILFTTEAPMGNAAVVDLEERFALAQRAICFHFYGNMNTRFMTLQLLSPLFQAILDSAATGMTAKGIKGAKLKRLPVALPPLAEQHRIIAKVDELMTLCDDLEARLTDAADTRRALLEASLHEALATA